MTLESSDLTLNATSVPLITVGLLSLSEEVQDDKRAANLTEISSKTLLELCRNPSQTTLIGQVLLKNYSYEKQVNIRYSFDDWQTVLEKPLRWAYSESVDFDVFVFQIDLSQAGQEIDSKNASRLQDHHLKQPTFVNLQFCLFYSWMGGCEWANNRERNYRVSIYTVQRIKVVKRMKSRKILPKRVADDPKIDTCLQNEMKHNLYSKEEKDASFSLAASFLSSKLRSFRSTPNFRIPTTAVTTTLPGIREDLPCHEVDGGLKDPAIETSSSFFSLSTSLISPTTGQSSAAPLKSWLDSFF